VVKKGNEIMKIRSQVSMVFHLDKCIGCHTCSVACKNIWTDRKGAEYMWWNNVETKPGTGYPTQWEDQEKYKGGWELPDKKNALPQLKLQNRVQALGNLFSNPSMPTMDDYYEPWSYEYDQLFNAAPMDDQPTAWPVSKVDGKPMEIEAGPNWDDDLSGSQIYASNDPMFQNLSEAEKQQLFSIERLFYFYLPRMCNHCVNPACVAACPSGAIYKRGEDGIVLINQDKCRGWRMCISACPYKKTFYNWATGKSEKCILCFPRLETGQAPACFHSCVGRIRYLGVLLYDADRIPEAMKAPECELVQRQRDMILDPSDPQVIAAARASGIPDGVLEVARRSPVYRYVKEWEMALPLHPEFRTLPMLFYVPPLMPVLNSTQENGAQRVEGDMFSTLENARLPIRYVANLLAAGNDEPVINSYRKMIAVRVYKRAQTVGDVSMSDAMAALNKAGITEQQAEGIYHLTSLASYQERFAIPPMARESAIEALTDPQQRKADAGFGKRQAPQRGW
jgi:nitrate reductase / nitrite oxidoreductase, beta subunit